MPKKHQLGITEEDMRIPGESSSKSRNMSSKKGWGSTNAQEKNQRVMKTLMMIILIYLI